MTGYTRFSFEEREKTLFLLSKDFSQKEIANILDRHPSTICRELKRCKVDSLGYSAVLAQSKKENLQARYKGKIISDKIKYFIIESLEKGHSPEQIAGRLKIISPQDYISHETIYKYIYSSEGQGLKLCLLLPKKRLKRKMRYGRRPRRSNIPPSANIINRPKSVLTRKKIGHWEGDLVISTSRKSSNITSLVERKSRAAILILNSDKRSKTVISGISRAFDRLPKKFKKTITFDRGTEFASYKSLNLQTYFCNPHSPWEKGGNENFNGRLRRFFPKNYNHNDLSQDKLDYVASLMNNTPRKCLGFKTPYEVLYGQIPKPINHQLR